MRFPKVNQSNLNIFASGQDAEKSPCPSTKEAKGKGSPTYAKGPVLRLERFTVLVIDTKGCLIPIRIWHKGQITKLRNDLWLSFLLKQLFIIWILSIYLKFHEALVTFAYRSEAEPLNCFPLYNFFLLLKYTVFSVHWRFSVHQTFTWWRCLNYQPYFIIEW